MSQARDTPASPSEGRSRFTHDGLTFEVEVGGPPDGEPVVLLHGFPQDASAWDAVATLLHRQGLRTLAPNQRGYSPGARPRRTSAYRMSHLCNDILALLDDAGLDRAHVVGHDWGGAVAWALAGAAPTRVATLTVLSTPHPSAMVHALPRGQALRSWYMGAFQLPFLPELVLRPSLERMLTRDGLPAPHAQRYAQRMAAPGALTAALQWYRALPGQARHGLAPRTGVSVPTTYLWGRRDPFLGRTAARATQRWVAADYRFVELDAGHWLPETEPATVAAVIIDRVRGGGGGGGLDGGPTH